MKHHSPERREAVLRKMAPPHNMTVPEAEVDIPQFIMRYNHERPHRTNGYLTPVAFERGVA